MANTVVVFTADHGEEFKEHGKLGNGKTLVGEQLGVPLIIAGHPAFGPGTRRNDLVSLIDLAPSLLKIAGATPPGDLRGRSFISDPAQRDEPVFAESIRWGVEQRAARLGPYKLIHHLSNNRYYYYDVSADPGEQRPLRKDPTRGNLPSAMADYAQVADSGWHVKLGGLTEDPLREDDHSNDRTDREAAPLFHPHAQGGPGPVSHV